MAHEPFRLVGFGQFQMQVFGDALGELEHGFDSGRGQQVRILFADAFDPEQVGAVDPFEDHSMADARLLSKDCPAMRCCPGLQQLIRDDNARSEATVALPNAGTAKRLITSLWRQTCRLAIDPRFQTRGGTSEYAAPKSHG